MVHTVKSTGPATPSAQRNRMMEMWSNMDAIRGGTERMRMAGTRLTPMHAGEEKERYADRITQATLFNQTKITLGGWVGRPFRDPLKLGEDVPPEIMTIQPDIDRLGTNMDTFARRWFQEGVAKAFCHVLIEAPEFHDERDPERTTPSVGEVQEQGIRPYWILIEPEEIIAARSATINGKQEYVHVRISEVTMEIDPKDKWSEIPVKRIRVYDRIDGKVFVTLYKRVEAEKENTEEGWVQDEGVRQLGISKIPLVTFYSDYQGFLLGRSPLQDLCDLNIRHFNSQSDQDAILTIARFPILAGSGISGLNGDEGDGASDSGRTLSDRNSLVIGPFNVLFTSEPGGKFYYVEHSGKSIKAGQDSLDALEAKMCSYGSEFLKKSPDRQTATARTLDSAEATSPLQDVVLKFKNAFETALGLTAEWFGLAPLTDGKLVGGTVIITTEFGPEEATGVDFDILKNARLSGDISNKMFLKELHRRGVLVHDFDFDQNERELEAEAVRLAGTMAPAASSDLDGPDEDKKEIKEDDKTKSAQK